MSERPREDEQATRSSSADPYGYLTAGAQSSPSYLPGDVEEERASARTARTAPAAGTAATTGSDAGETPAVPPAGSGDGARTDDEDDDVTVGMTRRELRERRARRAERAAAAASVPIEPVSDTGRQSEETAPAIAPARATDEPEPAHRADGGPDGGEDIMTLSPSWVPTGRAPEGASALTPGWHDPAARPRERRRRRLIWIVVGVLLAAAIAVAVTLWLNRDEETPPEPTATATEAAPTGLAAMLPSTVNGGEFSEGGPTGTVYTLDADGLVPNPLPPEGASESLTGLYTGGTVDVSLVASTFPSVQEALDAATAQSEALGTPVDTGVVFPDSDLGRYWTFNNDGLVTVVWHDGAEGAFAVVSEDAEDALGFYNGLEF